MRRIVQHDFQQFVVKNKGEHTRTVDNGRRMYQTCRLLTTDTDIENVTDTDRSFWL